MRRFIALVTALVLCVVCTLVSAGAVQTELSAAAADVDAASAAVEAVTVPRIDVVTEGGNGASLQKADGYVNAQITITDTDGSVLSNSVSFKVRGNSTAMESVLKKSFTFKFSKKTEVLGMGKGKKWAMLSNVFDPTLLRNMTIFDLARELELPYTSEQRVVELWLDGSYHGCYVVYEPVQEGKDRVNIDIESNDGKKDFLIEYEATRNETDVTYLSVSGMRFAVSEPEEPTEDQLAYITGVMTDIVNTLKGADEAQVREKIDVDSFAAYYLLNEYAKTLDFAFSSVFFFYQDGKLYAGPAWDYDLSTGNVNNTLTSSAVKASYPTDGFMHDKTNFYRWLCDKDWFQDEIKDVFNAHSEYILNIAADGGLLDTMRARYSDVIDHNYTRWNVAKWWMNYQRKPLKTYEENYAVLKNWCAERGAWLAEYYRIDEEPEILLGDADGDGLVTILDATAIQRHLANLETKVFVESAADTSGNGDVDILDATAIQRWLANFPDYEAIGQPIG